MNPCRYYPKQSFIRKLIHQRIAYAVTIALATGLSGALEDDTAIYVGLTQIIR